MRLPPQQVMPSVLAALHGIVASDRNLFDWTDEHGKLLHYCIEGPIDVGIAQLYFDEFHNHREDEAMLPFGCSMTSEPVVRSARELDHPGFFRSALYNEVWRPQGFHYRLEAVLRGSRRQLLGSLVLYRSRGEARFTHDDERALASVLPYVTRAVEPAAPEVIDGDGESVPVAAETVLVHSDGRIAQASSGASRLLLMLDGGAGPRTLSAGAGPPGQTALRKLLGMVERSAAKPGPPFNLPIVNAWGRFDLKATPLQRLDLTLPNLLPVTITQLEPARLALLRCVQRLPLSPGQIEVCQRLYDGQSQRAIGQELGVAEATVVDHVRKIYRRLDIRSAFELRIALDAKMSN